MDAAHLARVRPGAQSACRRGSAAARAGCAARSCPLLIWVAPSPIPAPSASRTTAAASRRRRRLTSACRRRSRNRSFGPGVDGCTSGTGEPLSVRLFRLGLQPAKARSPSGAGGSGLAGRPGGSGDAVVLSSARRRSGRPGGRARRGTGCGHGRARARTGRRRTAGSRARRTCRRTRTAAGRSRTATASSSGPAARTRSASTSATEWIGASQVIRSRCGSRIAPFSGSVDVRVLDQRLRQRLDDEPVQARRRRPLVRAPGVRLLEVDHVHRIEGRELGDELLASSSPPGRA